PRVLDAREGEPAIVRMIPVEVGRGVIATRIGEVLLHPEPPIGPLRADSVGHRRSQQHDEPQSRRPAPAFRPPPPARRSPPAPHGLFPPLGFIRDSYSRRSSVCTRS